MPNPRPQTVSSHIKKQTEKSSTASVQALPLLLSHPARKAELHRARPALSPLIPIPYPKCSSTPAPRPRARASRTSCRNNTSNETPNLSKKLPLTSRQNITIDPSTCTSMLAPAPGAVAIEQAFVTLPSSPVSRLNVSSTHSSEAVLFGLQAFSTIVCRTRHRLLARLLAAAAELRHVATTAGIVRLRSCRAKRLSL